MASEIAHMHQDIEVIKKDLDFIKHILAEEYELSDEAKKQLALANRTPISEYVDQKEVRKKLL